MSQENISEYLNPSRFPRMAFGLKANSTLNRITLTPSNANPGETLYISCGYTTPRLGVFPRLMISAWCRLGVPRVSDYPKRRGYTPNKLPKANKLKHFHLAGNG